MKLIVVYVCMIVSVCAPLHGMNGDRYQVIKLNTPPGSYSETPYKKISDAKLKESLIQAPVFSDGGAVEFILHRHTTQKSGDEVINWALALNELEAIRSWHVPTPAWVALWGLSAANSYSAFRGAQNAETEMDLYRNVGLFVANTLAAPFLVGAQIFINRRTQNIDRVIEAIKQHRRNQ